MEKKIVIIAEHVYGSVCPITYELIACGEAILDSKPGSMEVVIIGAKITTMAHQIAKKTGHNIVGVTVPGLDTYHGGAYCDVLQELYTQDPFDYLCAAHSSSGIDFTRDCLSA